MEGRRCTSKRCCKDYRFCDDIQKSEAGYCSLGRPTEAIERYKFFASNRPLYDEERDKNKHPLRNAV